MFYPLFLYIYTVATARTLSWEYEAPSVVLGQESQLHIDAEVSFVDNEATVAGRNLWQLGLFGSRNVNGRGQRIGEMRQILRAEKSATPLGQSTPDGLHKLQIENIETDFDLSTIGCGAFPYLCLEFAQTDRPLPRFELSFEGGATSLISCKLLQCENGESLLQCLSS